MADVDTIVIPALADEAGAPAPTPLMHKAASVVGNWAARTAGSGIATAALLPCCLDPHSWPQIWQELWQMQQAVWRQQFQMQNTWLQGWVALSDELTQARGANTMTKLVEQEFDLVAQWQTLLRDQSTDVVRLLENLEVNYAYWVSEKLR
jgi:hypothetical protein